MKSSTTSLHSWLMSDRPASRRQAAWGRAYGAWRIFCLLYTSDAADE